MSGETEEEVGIGKRGHTEEEILRVLRDAESGETVVEVCRKHGISQQNFYLWKKKYGGFQTSTTLRSLVPDLADRLLKKRAEYVERKNAELHAMLSAVLRAP